MGIGCTYHLTYLFLFILYSCDITIYTSEHRICILQLYRSDASPNLIPPGLRRAVIGAMMGPEGWCKGNLAFRKGLGGCGAYYYGTKERKAKIKIQTIRLWKLSRSYLLEAIFKLNVVECRCKCGRYAIFKNVFILYYIKIYMHENSRMQRQAQTESTNEKFILSS